MEKDIRHSWAIDVLSVGLILVGGLLLLVGQSPSDESGGVDAPPMRQAGTEWNDFAELLQDAQWIGPEGAPSVVAVYCAYTCSFCHQLHDHIQALRRRYPQHMAVVWRHFVDSADASRSLTSVAAECAGEQGLFKAFQAVAHSAGQATTYSDAWLSLAHRVEGLDLPMFQDCVRSRRYLGRIQRHARDAEGRGITVTPTLWINGHRINGLPPAEVLDSLVVAAFRDPSRRAGLQSER